MIDIRLTKNGFQTDENWNTFVKLVEPHDELPIPDAIENIYLDFETTSGDSQVPSTNPHGKCSILGVAVLFDSDSCPYYIPLRHYYYNESGEPVFYEGNRRNIAEVHEWLKTILNKAKKWINHNIKYDYHVLYNETGYRPSCRLIDTLNLCKLAPYQERFSYGLTEMMRFFNLDISYYEVEIKKSLGKEFKDYGLIPIFPMAPYAGVDTLCVRYLYDKMLREIPRECDRVVSLEQNILPMLIEMEQVGIRVNYEKIFEDANKIAQDQIVLFRQLKELSGIKHLDVDTKAGLKAFFIDHLGWQVDLTDKGQESFGKQSILKYKSTHPQLVDTWLKYQSNEKLMSGFLLPYIAVHVDGLGLMHGSFNQIVRTGRMSCSYPNLQQLPMSVKEYIVPYDDDYVLVEFDLSQIEFRVIVHYIGNKRCTADYLSNPKTDFHSWVATMCQIHRKPAKNINFMLGYGGGKEKCLTMLSSLPEIIENCDDISTRSLSVYNSYHAALPELKPTQRRATAVCYSRGYVRTLLGRRRYLHQDFTFKAFNSVCQGSAADIQKDITLRLRKYISIECLLHALVHDSWLFSIKRSRVEELVPLIKQEIERPIEGVDFSIPLVSDYGSGNTWRDCDA